MKPGFLRNAARAVGPPRYLGHLALEAGLITEMQLAQALEEQESLDPRPKLGELLVLRGWLDPADVDELLKKQSQLRGTGEHSSGPPDGTVAVNRLGRFHLVKHLGSGGAGEVWKAWDSRLLRWVAIKTLRFPVPAQRERFLREARLTAKLQHPHIVPIHEVDQVEGVDFLVMEFKDGASLWHTMLPLREALKAVRQVCDAVAHLHEADIIHRDIKPHNIMLARNGDAFLTDLGLARALESEGITLQGTLLGTPAYMAPEQARDSRFAGAPSDIYALGGVLYFVTTHRDPCEGATVNEVLSNLKHADVTRPRVIDPKIPRDVETIILRAMERDPYRRYPTARALGDDIDRYLKGDPIQARPVSLARRVTRTARRHTLLIAGSILVTAVAAISAWMIHRANLDKQRTQEAANLKSAAAERQARFDSDLRALSDRLAAVENLIYQPVFDVEARSRQCRAIREKAWALGLEWPKSPEPDLLMTRASLALQEIEPARVALLEALRKGPDGAKAAALLARIRLEDWFFWRLTPDEYSAEAPRRRAEAERAMQETIADSTTPSEWETVQKLLQGHQHDAVRRKCLERIGEGGHYEDFAFLLGCEEFAGCGDRPPNFEEAERCFGLAVQCAPGMVQAYRMRAWLRNQRQDLAGSAADAAAWVRLAPADGAAHLARAQAVPVKGPAEADRAIPDFRRALEWSPWLLHARVGLGIAYSRKGDIASAEAEFETALAVYPNSTYFLYQRAEARGRNDRIGEAMGDLTAALAVNPDDEACRSLRGRLFFARKDFENAQRDVDHILKKRTPRTGDLYILSARLQGQAGRCREGIEDLELARKLPSIYSYEIDPLMDAFRAALGR